ncbi:Apolipoprotein N-acyltransferase [Hartmannibacter diazotrophicus]|uniref:Apolipoprotein N-acyltransferase n=1 Tax=Hartmannibacter diazotrophicus TaxID=1482074 RepID=A0A2C9DD79_9HYPH|nr:apolipoprotein N-acyltransferase [Hartmannibacter diazotrophicus]SON58206.1 Apolipoprotein N-acyltransferase [Hartmannibacter diazotrophicus]
MRAIENWVLLLWGWKRWALALALGAASAMAMAPVDAFPVLFVTFPLLVWLIDGTPATSLITSLRGAFAVGWWLGFGYFLAGLWWISSAFLVEADVYGWMTPIITVIIPAGFAFFWAFAVCLARILWLKGPGRIVMLAFAMALAEWLRGHVLTGFPWILIGQAFGASDVTAQAASLVGVYGLTFLGVLIFSAPALLTGSGSEGRGRAQRVWLAIAAILMLGDIGYGSARLGGAEADTVDGINLRIVQPSIQQNQKWTEEGRAKALQTYLDLSDTKTSPDDLGILSRTHLIWPETALPFILSHEPDALAKIGEALPPGTLLLTGAPRAVKTPNFTQFFNSVYVIGNDGEIEAAYDKAHLVPFGEYVPLNGLFVRLGLGDLTRMIGGFSKGPGAKTISLPGTPPFAILICYEIIFPDSGIDENNRPQWIVNVTNDGWFGKTFGPYQHLELTRLRAIEEGLPVVRAANTGISAIIDAYGRPREQAPLEAVAVVDGQLPPALPPTLYVRNGRAIFWSLLLASLVFWAFSRFRQH